MIVHKPVIVFVLSLVLTGFSACSPRALHEAEEVVRTADSLRAAGQMYGIDTGDSATLAQAYETLKPFAHFPSSFCTSFTHACYHYGRLLREKDNPVAAMECFISASHAHTRDYHILGRVYSNMGDICHLAGEYPFSYDMFARAADMFLRNGDTLTYYYALNEMAYELAEQGKRGETLELIDEIPDAYNSIEIVDLSNLAKITLYSNIEEYDSVLLLSSKIHSNYSQVYSITAYSFWALNMYDSALVYARNVLESSSASEQDKYNMLYIVLNYDSTLQNEEIIALSACRSDIETDILIPRHNKWAMAVQLLEQDLNKGPDLLKWILSALIIIGSIGTFLFAYRWRIRKRHMYNQISALANEKADNRTESIKNYIDVKDFRQTLHWGDYSKMKSDVDLYMGGLATKLEKYNLNEVQVRFCVLTMLDMPLRKIAKEIYYSYPSATKTLKKRISDKLGTTPPQLKEFLLHL